MRDYNITKKEWTLDGEIVLYGSASELRGTLDYDFSQEKSFSYKGLAMDEIIHHLAKFVYLLYGRFIFSLRKIQERQLYSLLSIFELWDSRLLMIFSRRMLGILGMHWLEQTITILLREYMKPRNSWSCF